VTTPTLTPKQRAALLRLATTGEVTSLPDRTHIRFHKWAEAEGLYDGGSYDFGTLEWAYGEVCGAIYAVHEAEDKEECDGLPGSLLDEIWGNVALYRIRNALAIAIMLKRWK
jgi:hypothetical protein